MKDGCIMQKKNSPTKSELFAKDIIEQYNLQSVEDMQNTLKYIFALMFEAMLQGEMNYHLGYKSSDHYFAKSSINRRNDYTSKFVNTSIGSVEIKTP